MVSFSPQDRPREQISKLEYSEIQAVVNSTRTINKPQLSQHLRQELAMDSLRYEMELFAFIQSVLYKKYTSFGFHPEDWDPKFLF